MLLLLTYERTSTYRHRISKTLSTFWHLASVRTGVVHIVPGPKICNAVHTTNHHVSRVFTRVLAVGYSGGCRGHGSPMVRLLHFYVRKESYVAFHVDEVAVAF